ncbi:ROK family transcriptional regulator [Alteromonas gilva]|uniref:ROK family transcriptional regulator n=1 Tax=Alteromonas gilva TaxID=2987522 RepID=A0ABT5L2I9_9ALTE|nr:ROK family transcriptional regulator [Alteromonas gilva]MDC8831256.1 ROK family transcriptional regulator [Alteromonas gilva]
MNNNIFTQRAAPLALMTDRQFFHCLKTYGPMTRADIAKKTGISRPTISESAQRLESSGLVVETCRAKPKKQGRAGVIYEINAHKGLTMAIAIGVKQIQLRLTDLSLKVIREHCFSIDPAWQQDDLSEAVIRFIRLATQDQSPPLLAIGVSVAVPVNSQTGDIHALPYSKFTVIHGINFKQVLSETFGCPVIIDNDVNWAALAEKTIGIARGVANFVFIYFGEGIGAGVYMDNYVIRGVAGISGEIGHIMVNPTENLQDFVTNHKLQKALENNEELTNHPAIKQICQTLATIAATLNPEMFVLGGPMTKFDQFIPAIVKEITPLLFNSVNVVPSNAPNYAPLNGVEAGAYELALLSFGVPAPASEE